MPGMSNSPMVYCVSCRSCKPSSPMLKIVELTGVLTPLTTPFMVRQKRTVPGDACAAAINGWAANAAANKQTSAATARQRERICMTLSFGHGGRHVIGADYRRAVPIDPSSCVGRGILGSQPHVICEVRDRLQRTT